MNYKKTLAYLLKAMDTGSEVDIEETVLLFFQSSKANDVISFLEQLWAAVDAITEQQVKVSRTFLEPNAPLGQREFSYSGLTIHELKQHKHALNEFVRLLNEKAPLLNLQLRLVAIGKKPDTTLLKRNYNIEAAFEAATSSFQVVSMEATILEEGERVIRDQIAARLALIEALLKE